jgi:hypothetical protein
MRRRGRNARTYAGCGPDSHDDPGVSIRGPHSGQIDCGRSVPYVVASEFGVSLSRRQCRARCEYCHQKQHPDFPAGCHWSPPPDKHITSEVRWWDLLVNANRMRRGSSARPNPGWRNGPGRTRPESPPPPSRTGPARCGCLRPDRGVGLGRRATEGADVPGDLPARTIHCPRHDDAAAAKLLRAAQADKRLLVQVTVEVFLPTGRRVSEFTSLTADTVVQTPRRGTVPAAHTTRASGAPTPTRSDPVDARAWPSTHHRGPRHRAGRHPGLRRRAPGRSPIRPARPSTACTS